MIEGCLFKSCLMVLWGEFLKLLYLFEFGVLYLNFVDVEENFFVEMELFGEFMCDLDCCLLIFICKVGEFMSLEFDFLCFICLVCVICLFLFFKLFVFMFFYFM